MPDHGPLQGRTAVVTGDDPALRHAALLLRHLGAEVVDAPVPDALLELGHGPAALRPWPHVVTDPAVAAQDWARSGAMHLTGRPGGPALAAPGAPASAVRGALLLLEALTLARGSSVPGPPGWPDLGLLGERAALAGLQRGGPWSAGGAFSILPCQDGALGLSLPRADDLTLLPALLRRPVGADIWAEVAAWARGQDAAGAAERAQLLGLAAAAVAGEGAYADEQAVSRGGNAPRPFVCTRGGRRRPGRRPLVVDLTSLWAGPLCAHLLALTGARVVKVESTRRPDGGRGGPPAFYDLLHAGHESVALDFEDAGGRRRLRALVDAADVVLESSRPRALLQLGVDAQEHVAGGVVWTSITAYGRTGPWAHRVGFGDDVAVAGGLVATDGGRPVPCGDALADPLAGVHAAVATAAALLDDAGHLVDVSMRDVVAATVVGVDPDLQAAGPVLPPRARAATGRAAPLGADTARLLAELALP